MTVPPSSLAVAPKVKGEKEFEAGSPAPATQGALKTYNGGYITGSRVSTLPRPRAHVFRKDAAVKSHRTNERTERPEATRQPAGPPGRSGQGSRKLSHTAI